MKRLSFQWRTEAAIEMPRETNFRDEEEDTDYAEHVELGLENFWESDANVATFGAPDAVALLIKGELPSGCYIRGNVAVENLETLTIPNDIHFLDDLTIKDVQHLTIGKGLWVKGDLHLYSSHLENTPEQATVAGSLYADRDTLPEVPEDMRVMVAADLLFHETVDETSADEEDGAASDDEEPFSMRAMGWQNFQEMMASRGMNQEDIQEAWDDA